MNLKTLPYIGIIVLLLIILLQNKGCLTQTGKHNIQIDTVVVYIPIYDTIVGNPLPPVIEKDTVWMTKTEFVPDTTYQGLLNQYTFLGNNYFEKRTFSTTFQIADYGFITSIDTVLENSLMGTSLITELNIPVTTITIEKKVSYRALYIGTELSGNKLDPLNGVYISSLFKTKKDNIYGFSIGYTGEIVFKGSLHWKLRIK